MSNPQSNSATRPETPVHTAPAAPATDSPRHIQPVVAPGEAWSAPHASGDGRDAATLRPVATTDTPTHEPAPTGIHRGGK